ncbi:MAG: T9SS type A sorting domain-containing protein [Flavobacteriales bacterium]|nr:T9SS type A sorting domain-containing protein [Flavobacteriales bacterium]
MMTHFRLRDLVVFFFLLRYCAPEATAQAGQWTWVKGPQAPGGAGLYGTQGVAAAANHPPGCVNQYSWTAQDGTFWMFGGQANTGEALAALWKYDPATNLWTWMKGPSSFYFLGNFGTQGVEAATNLPPAKTFGGASWVDLDGNFWMYGGENGDNYNQDANNDLWKYDPNTNNWTWMKGTFLDNPPAVWGSMGVPDINNQPPARTTCYGTWVDDQGDLWMFGGMMPPPVDDLWRYNIATNTWTWMNGSQVPNTVAVYGTLGVQAASNTPGARIAHALGKDADGMLWMQGGALGAGYYGWGDVWRLDPASGEWTWMSGSSSANPPVSTGTACVPNIMNDPGRRVNCPTWQTLDGRMWTFGLMSSSGQPNFNYTRNDMWTFCPTTLTWTWVHGPAVNDVPGNWGTLGVASPANLPNGRSMASAWVAQNGDLYLFGGVPIGAFTTYGDLWRFTPDAACGPCNSVLEVGEATADGISIHPNPAVEGSLSVTLPDGSWSIDVLDMSGRKVGTTSVGIGNTSLDIAHVPNGSYMLVARSSQQVYKARFMVAH